MSNQNKPKKQEIKRYPDRPRMPFASKAILATSIFSGLMLGAAMPNLIGDDSWVGIGKSLLIAGAATTVSYMVNRLAIEKGAPLTAINFAGAGITSITSVLFVGAGLFASTFAGLTIGSVSELKLQEYGTELSQFITDRNQIAAKASQAGPAIEAIAADLKIKATCEVQSSCVSGRENGGRGTVSRVLEDKSARANGIKEQFTKGEAKRSASLARANQLLSEYQKILNNDDKSMRERRIALQKIDTGIAQATSGLDEALPISLLKAYASELKSGTEIHERPVATQRLNAILSAHGKSLSDVVNNIKTREQARPIFPAKTGVADTFSYIGHFAPIAAVTAVVELVFPLTLWLYTFFTLFWLRYKDDPPETEGGNDDDDGFGGLINISQPQKDKQITRFSNNKPRHRTLPKTHKRGS